MGFFVPPGFEFAVDLGEACRQGRINDDFQVAPALAGGAVYQPFQLVEQFLRTAHAEGGQYYGAAVFQRAIDGGFQAVATVAPVFMQAVAVGAFEYQGVGAVWRLGCG